MKPITREGDVRVQFYICYKKGILYTQEMYSNGSQESTITTTNVSKIKTYDLCPDHDNNQLRKGIIK